MIVCAWEVKDQAEDGEHDWESGESLWEHAQHISKLRI